MRRTRVRGGPGAGEAFYRTGGRTHVDHLESRVASDTRFGQGIGSSDANRRRTFSVILETLLSYSLNDKLPLQAIELVEKTAPPLGYSAYAMSAFTRTFSVPPCLESDVFTSSTTC